MARAQASSREVVLKPSAAKTATGAGSSLTVPEGYSQVQVWVDCTARSGTSPTLDLKIQDARTGAASADLEGAQPTGTVVWDDFAAFTQMTNTGQRTMRIVASTSSEAAAADGALTAGTIRAGAISGPWRVKWVIGGTNPSFTFSVVAKFIP